MQRRQHTRGPIHGILFARRKLIPEPQRSPCAIVPLRLLQERERAADAIINSLPESAADGRSPSRPSQQCVRGQVGSAAIERQPTPPTAKRRRTAIAVLQIEQPLDS